MKAIWLIPASLAVAAVVTLTTAPAAQAQGLEAARDQGILYFKKDHFRPAMAQLDKAYAAPGGKEDFLTVYYRSRTAYKLLLLEVAFEMANQAKALAGEDEKKQVKIDEFLGEMGGLYGGVTIKPAEGETNKEGRIFLEAKTGIINREKKARFMSIRERFRTTDIKVPTTIYLPYGEYLANNVPFAVVQGEDPPTVEVFLQVVQKEVEAGMSPWIYVGIAGGVAVAAGVVAVLLLSEDTTVVEDRTVINLNETNMNLVVRP